LTDHELNALVAVTSPGNGGVTAATARVAFGMLEEEKADECGDVCSADPQLAFNTLRHGSTYRRR